MNQPKEKSYIVTEIEFDYDDATIWNHIQLVMMNKLQTETRTWCMVRL